ncbi:MULTISPECIES: hypothetical protein [Nostocales]|uniref:Uncharacterized protein n=3 Tax=Nostocales TaxID=1161 RepID=A0A0C1R5V8_9CYAN|nr:hypothetical protein [Tolypothrix bouteillei]KAF3888129.1 hypothetical protein DA73_0400023515 [Tolypothrix bouteillei VB521301]
MNIKVIGLAAILGLSAPAITDIVLNPQSAVAMPTDFVRPTGAFTDSSQEWVVKLNLDQFGIYTYSGQNIKQGSDLTLKNPEMSGNNQSYTYTFKNNNYKYIITYQPSDKKHIRLTVVNPQGSTILNKLMAKV